MVVRSLVAWLAVSVVAIGSACSLVIASVDELSGGGADASGEELVESGQDNPTAIAADSTGVYWVNTVSAGSVEMCPLTGCAGARVTIASDQAMPSGIGLNFAYVGWASLTDKRVRYGKKATGSSVEELAYGGGQLIGPFEVALRTSKIFWLDPGSVLGCPFDPSCSGSSIQPTAYGLDNVIGLSLSDTAIYFASGDELIHACGVDCSSKTSPPVVASGQNKPHATGFDDANVYWTNSGDGTVMMLARDADAGTPTAIASGFIRTWGIAVDATDPNVYFTDIEGGVVARVAKTGGQPEVLASGQSFPWGIALAPGYVYWTNSGDGTIMRRAR